MKRLLIIAAICIAPAANAQQFIGGVGNDTDFGGNHLVAEYHGIPFRDTGRFQASLGVAGRIDGDGDAWVGAGIALEQRLGQRAFLELSFMPGYYSEQEDNLGGSLQFRSLIGIGYDLTETSAISLSIDHLSNGGIEDFNPGAEAVALRYRYRF